MQAKIEKYVKRWKSRGYPGGIPDEVPSALMHKDLAPSYKAIAIAILKNDTGLHSLGFAPIHSEWYNELKRIEISQRA